MKPAALASEMEGFLAILGGGAVSWGQGSMLCPHFGHSTGLGSEEESDSSSWPWQSLQRPETGLKRSKGMAEMRWAAGLEWEEAVGYWLACKRSISFVARAEMYWLAALRP